MNIPTPASSRFWFPCLASLLLSAFLCGCGGKAPDSSTRSSAPTAVDTERADLHAKIRELEEANAIRRQLDAANAARNRLEKDLAEAKERKTRTEAQLLQSQAASSRWKGIAACAGAAALVALFIGAGMGSAARHNAVSRQEGIPDEP